VFISVPQIFSKDKIGLLFNVLNFMVVILILVFMWITYKYKAPDIFRANAGVPEELGQNIYVLRNHTQLTYITYDQYVECSKFIGDEIVRGVLMFLWIVFVLITQKIERQKS
jgi:hypothetical protein